MDSFGAASIKSLFGRDCLECDTTPPLVCPSCSSGTVCVQVGSNCTQCAYNTCTPSALAGTTTNGSSHQSGPNIGAIVGGIIGGLLVVGIATWLVWHFVIRKRRQQWESEYDVYSDKSDTPQYPRTLRPGNRASLASTTYTRASNVIQIAFIPGVTGRAEDPVPPVPASQAHSPYTDASGDHYFMPGDLRDSTYSGFTDDGASINDRRSMARSIAPSIAPSLLRQSVGSALFNDDGVQNPMPAQTAQRGRANMVSVQRAPGSSGTATPAVPTIDRTRFPVIPTVSQSKAGSSVPSKSETTAAPLVNIEVTPDNASDMTTATTLPSEVKDAIELATRRASQQPVHGGLGSVKAREPSPFSDANRLSDSTASIDLETQ